MEKAFTYLPLLGRIFLSSIFLMSALNKMGNWEGTAGYMASAGMPLIPFFLVCAIAFELMGGLSVLLGIFARWGAVALVVFLVPSTIIFHNFWKYEGMEQQMQMIMFMKNLSILGGLLLVAGLGSGPFSLESRFIRK